MGEPSTDAGPPTTERAIGWLTWCTTVLGVFLVGGGLGLVGFGYRQALGPFLTIDTPSGPFGCGSPFLSRYIAGRGDPLAPDYRCYSGAPTHRQLVFILGGIGLGLVLAGFMATRPTSRRKVTDITRPRSTRETAAAAVHWLAWIVAFLGVLLMVGGGVAYAVAAAGS